MTELDVECIQQVTAFVDIDSTLTHRPTVAYFNQPHLYFASPFGMTQFEFRRKIESLGYRVTLFA